MANQRVPFSKVNCGAFFRSDIPGRDGTFIKAPQNSHNPALVNIWTNAMRVLPDMGVIGFGPTGFEYFKDDQIVELIYFRLVEIPQ